MLTENQLGSYKSAQEHADTTSELLSRKEAENQCLIYSLWDSAIDFTQ